MAIEVGCHKWTFGNCSIGEAAHIVRALGFGCMDLGSSQDFDPAYIAKNVADEASRFRKIRGETGIRFVDAVPIVEPAFSSNHPSDDVRAEYRRTLLSFFDFAELIQLTGVTLSAGRFWPSEPAEVSKQRSADELGWAVTQGKERGLEVRIEPHVRGITWTPELAVEMVQMVPGLSLTIDHSHFVINDLPYEQIAMMHPYGTHWHARQARPGELQCRWEVGEVDFERILGDLSHGAYDGVMCLEYGHSEWMQQDNVDCVHETVVLRDHLRTLLS
jgi:sugar phosphate isomerase/epimerase